MAIKQVHPNLATKPRELNQSSNNQPPRASTIRTNALNDNGGGGTTLCTNAQLNNATRPPITSCTSATNDSTNSGASVNKRKKESICEYTSSGASVNKRKKDTYKRTPLHIAAKEGNLDNVQALIKDGADVNAKDEDKKTPLHIAAEEGNLDIVQALIKYGADVNAKDEDEETPLHIAAEKGCVDIVKALIKNGADVNAKTNYYFFPNIAKTPLHIAAEEGNLNIVQVLIKSGGDVNAKDQYGETPLHKAARNDHNVSKTLIAAGADVNAKDDFDSLPLHYAQTPEMINILADENTVNEYDDEGRTPLSKAIASSKPDNVQALINHGADLFTTYIYKHNQTPLDFAKAIYAEEEEIDEQIALKEIIDILTKAMANPDKKNKI
ncbi:MAG: ankyrin repeat domain-containing protein [Candidatus Marinamargulisbacteria bacterium]